MCSAMFTMMDQYKADRKITQVTIKLKTRLPKPGQVQIKSQVKFKKSSVKSQVKAYNSQGY